LQALVKIGALIVQFTLKKKVMTSVVFFFNKKKQEKKTLKEVVFGLLDAFKDLQKRC